MPKNDNPPVNDQMLTEEDTHARVILSAASHVAHDQNTEPRSFVIGKSLGVERSPALRLDQAQEALLQQLRVRVEVGGQVAQRHRRHPLALAVAIPEAGHQAPRGAVPPDQVAVVEVDGEVPQGPCGLALDRFGRGIEGGREQRHAAVIDHARQVARRLDQVGDGAAGQPGLLGAAPALWDQVRDGRQGPVRADGRLVAIHEGQRRQRGQDLPLDPPVVAPGQVQHRLQAPLVRDDFHHVGVAGQLHDGEGGEVPHLRVRGVREGHQHRHRLLRHEVVVVVDAGGEVGDGQHGEPPDLQLDFPRARQRRLHRARRGIEC